MKKLIIVFSALVIVLLGALLYVKNFPKVELKKGGTNTDSRYFEIAYVNWAIVFDIAPSKRVLRQFDEFSKWNDEVVTGIIRLNQNHPCHIQVSGEMKDGKTTILYKGTYEDANGNTVTVNEEKTFDFYLCRKKNFFTHIGFPFG